MPELDIEWDFPLEETVEGVILAGTLDRIKALKLPCIADEKIVVRKLPWDDNIEPPYVLVTPVPESTPWQEGTNERDTTLFAVMVAVVLANARDVTTRGMGLQFYWRDRIRRKFHNKSQANWDLNTAFEANHTGTFFIHSYVESGDKFIEAAKREMRDAQYYVIRVHVREPRE
jgi:hypothetical protein